MLLMRYHQSCPSGCRTMFTYQVLGLSEERTLYLDRFESVQAWHWQGLVGAVRDGKWTWNGLGRHFTPAGGVLFNLRASFEPITEPVARAKYTPDFD